MVVFGFMNLDNSVFKSKKNIDILIQRKEDNNMTIIESILNNMLDELCDDTLYVEKATTEQYRLSKFKQKYHYNDKDKTIVVDGEKYKVDLDKYKSGTMTVRDKDGKSVGVSIRATSAELAQGDPIINIDRNFFKLKNSKRQDAILQHEIGHTKLHNVNPDNQHINSDAMSPIAYEQTFNTQYRNLKKQYGDFFTKEEMYKIVKESIPPKSAYVQKMRNSELEQKMRTEMINYAKKYEKTNKSEHANVDEFEADRYAANKTSAKDLKRAVREVSKKASSTKNVRKTMNDTFDISSPKVKKDDDTLMPVDTVKTYLKNTGMTDKQIEKLNINKPISINEYRKISREYMLNNQLKTTEKAIHKDIDVDIKARSKALKDRKLRDSKIYK